MPPDHRVMSEMCQELAHGVRERYKNCRTTLVLCGDSKRPHQHAARLEPSGHANEWPINQLLREINVPKLELLSTFRRKWRGVRRRPGVSNCFQYSFVFFGQTTSRSAILSKEIASDFCRPGAASRKAIVEGRFK